MKNLRNNLKVRKRIWIPLLILLVLFLLRSVEVYQKRRVGWSGVRYETYENGAPKIEKIYKLGKLIMIKRYDKQGQLISEENFDGK